MKTYEKSDMSQHGKNLEIEILGAQKASTLHVPNFWRKINFDNNFVRGGVINNNYD